MWFLVFSFVLMEASTHYWKKSNVWAKKKPNSYSIRSWRVCNICTTKIFFFGIWNWKIFCLMRRETLKLSILDYQDPIQRKKTRHFHFAAVPNIWLLRCFQSNCLLIKFRPHVYDWLLRPRYIALWALAWKVSLLCSKQSGNIPCYQKRKALFSKVSSNFKGLILD